MPQIADDDDVLVRMGSCEVLLVSALWLLSDAQMRTIVRHLQRHTEVSCLPH